MQLRKNALTGFTLIEILVVVALIAILAAITIIAINPAKNFADARNTQRITDVGNIADAMTRYIVDPGHTYADFGTIPACTGTPATIGSGTGNLNFTTLLVPTYMGEVPKDPSSGTAANT